MVIICITIMVLALITGATIVALKYLSADKCIEYYQDSQLHDISVICATIRENTKATESELIDAINHIYRISVTGCPTINEK